MKLLICNKQTLHYNSIECLVVDSSFSLDCVCAIFFSKETETNINFTQFQIVTGLSIHTLTLQMSFHSSISIFSSIYVLDILLYLVFPFCFCLFVYLFIIYWNILEIREETELHDHNTKLHTTTKQE